MNDVSLMKLLIVYFKIKRSGNDGKMKCLIIKDDQTLYRFDCVPSDFIFCYTFLVRFFSIMLYIYIYGLPKGKKTFVQNEPPLKTKPIASFAKSTHTDAK